MEKRKRGLVLVNNTGKILPQSVDLEEVVLGTIMENSLYISKYPYLKAEAFYKEENQIIYTAMLELYMADKKPDLLLVQDYLKTKGQLDAAGGPIYLTQLLSKSISYIDNYVKAIVDKYIYRKLIIISGEMSNKSFETAEDPVDIANEMQNKIMDVFDFVGDIRHNFKRSLESTIANIVLASKGENVSTIKTGHKKIDSLLAFRSKYICIIAGPEASGKTKFVISLVRGMLDHEKNLAVAWWSMEDDREQVIRSFLAMDIRLTTKELQNINYQLTGEDIAKIGKSALKYEDYNIEFYDKIDSIASIIARSKRFSERYRHHKKVIVLDNLGLIESDKIGIDRDDYIAGQIKKIADTTGTFILVVHHFTKEVARKANIEDGYRPRKEYLKGSTRILDYVQQALFVNLPRKYPDLLAAEKQTELTFIGNDDLEFTEDNFRNHLFSINQSRCKDTMTGVSDLYMDTFVKLTNILNNGANDLKGKPVTFPAIIQKYTEYSNHIDLLNRSITEADQRFRKPKASILAFLSKKMYNETFVQALGINSTRSKYLYGNDKNLRHHIDDLFIIESIKNRDDENIDEKSLIRYEVDLGYNLFKEL